MQLGTVPPDPVGGLVQVQYPNADFEEEMHSSVYHREVVAQPVREQEKSVKQVVAY